MPEDQNHQEDSGNQDLNPEIFKFSVQKLASMSDEIMETISYHRLTPPKNINSANFGYFHIFRTKPEGNDIYLLCEADEIEVEPPNPYSREFPNSKAKVALLIFREDEPSMIEGLEFKPEYMLRIPTHSDLQTQADIVKFWDSHKKLSSTEFRQGTSFLYDSEGNLVKIIDLPKKFKDSRKKFKGHGFLKDNHHKYVQSEMSGPDFELAGTALKAILNKIALVT